MSSDSENEEERKPSDLQESDDDKYDFMPLFNPEKYAFIFNDT